MAKVGLDAICAKLSRNAEISSRETDTCLPSHHDNNSDSGALSDGTSVASLPTSDDPVGRENAIVGNETSSSRAVDGATSTMDSGFGDEGEVAPAGCDGADDGGVADAGRCSRRRKNFLPRCVHDGQVVFEPRHAGRFDPLNGEQSLRRPQKAFPCMEARQVEDASAATSPTAWSENVEEDHVVLDLRTGPRSTGQTGDRPSSLVGKSGAGAHDGALDLSVSRSGGGRPGEWTTTDGASTEAGGGLNAADLRVCAADAMTELLHIYGLPDVDRPSAAAATDLRKWCSPDARSGTPSTLGGDEDRRPARPDADRRHVATAWSAGHMPNRVVRHTTGLSHDKGIVVLSTM